MNRIVLFSDVHGNITGLSEVFKEINKLEDVIHIIGCGDYFGHSAGANEIIDICLKNKVTLLRGDHEEYLRKIEQNNDNGELHPIIYKTHKWLKKWLSPDYFQYIINLPHDLSLNLNKNHSLYACHASKNDSHSFTCATDRDLNVLIKTYGDMDENIIVYGHHHESHIMPIQNKILINCASVGARQNDNKSNYTIIEYDMEKIAIIQKSVEYNIEEEIKLINERKTPRLLNKFII